MILKELYDAASRGDKGNLYAVRNFLEARNVTTDRNRMTNINGAADLIEKYTTVLVFAAAMQFFGLADLTDEPTKHTFNLEEHGDHKQYAEAVMAKFVDTYMLPASHGMKLEDKVFHCSKCDKKCMSRKGLLRHERSIHHGIPAVGRDSNAAVSDAQDRVLNYLKCALGMGMIALDFNDAREVGDEGRIIQLYRLLLLHCKAGNKPKYSYQILRFLAQVKCFLTPRLAYELIWNRTLNTKGQADSNAELDRSLEHRDKIFKEHSRGLHGNVRQKSVDRISRSEQAVHEALDNVDRQLEVREASSKHQVQSKMGIGGADFF